MYLSYPHLWRSDGIFLSFVPARVYAYAKWLVTSHPFQQTRKDEKSNSYGRNLKHVRTKSQTRTDENANTYGRVNRLTIVKRSTHLYLSPHAPISISPLTYIYLPTLSTAIVLSSYIKCPWIFHEVLLHDVGWFIQCRCSCIQRCFPCFQRGCYQLFFNAESQSRRYLSRHCRLLSEHVLWHFVWVRRSSGNATRLPAAQRPQRPTVHIQRIPPSKKISAFSAEHKPRLRRLCAFCDLTRQRQLLCISVFSLLAEPLRLCASALRIKDQLT